MRASAAAPPCPPLAGRGYTARLVLFGGLVTALTAPGQTAGVSAFVDPLIADLGVSRSVISTAYLIGTLTGAIALPLVGRLVDRHGVRAVMAFLAAIFGAFLAGLALVDGVTGLTIGFAGIRATGQGGLTMTASTALAVWIDRRRGTALGASSALGAAGISLFPLLLDLFIAGHGWRLAWLAQGVLVWAVIVPVAWWGMRPPHRDPALGAVPQQRAAEIAASAWTLRDAARTGIFWLFTAAVASSGLVTTAVAFHQISLLGEQGLSRMEAAANFLPQTGAGLAAGFLAGMLADRYPPRLLLAAAMAAQAFALATLPIVSPGWTALAYGVAVGASASAARTLEAAALPYYFGTANLGSLRGVVHAISVASTAFGPLVLAAGHDLAGNYRTPVLWLAVLPAAVALATPFVRPLRPRRAAAEHPALSRVVAPPPTDPL